MAKRKRKASPTKRKRSSSRVRLVGMSPSTPQSQARARVESTPSSGSGSDEDEVSQLVAEIKSGKRELKILLTRCDKTKNSIGIGAKAGPKVGMDDEFHLNERVSTTAAENTPRVPVPVPSTSRAAAPASSPSTSSSSVIQIISEAEAGPASPVAATVRQTPKPKLLTFHPANWDLAACLKSSNFLKRALPLKPTTRYSWYCCILWDEKIRNKLEEHRTKWDNRLFSTLGMGKLLAKAARVENPEMNWEKQFMLLKIMGVGSTRSGKNFHLRVAEVSTSENKQTPEKDRQYRLILHDYRDCPLLLQEMTRRPQTTIMVWNCKVDYFSEPMKDVPHSGQNIIGEITFTPDPDPRQPDNVRVPSLLIFHEEAIGPDRVRRIRGVFDMSELKHFDKPWLERTTKSKVYPDGEEQLAVHLARGSPSQSQSQAVLGCPCNGNQNQKRAGSNKRELDLPTLMLVESGSEEDVDVEVNVVDITDEDDDVIMEDGDGHEPEPGWGSTQSLGVAHHLNNSATLREMERDILEEAVRMPINGNGNGDPAKNKPTEIPIPGPSSGRKGTQQQKQLASATQAHLDSTSQLELLYTQDLDDDDEVDGAAGPQPSGGKKGSGSLDKNANANTATDSENSEDYRFTQLIDQL